MLINNDVIEIKNGGIIENQKLQISNEVIIIMFSNKRSSSNIYFKQGKTYFQ